MNRSLALHVLLSLLLAGCSGQQAPVLGPPPVPVPAPMPVPEVMPPAPIKPPGAAVLADVSVGTNPYHEVFRRPGWTEHPCTRVAGLPCDLPALKLTLGDDYASSLAADAATWASYQPGVVYWVPGTNLLLLTLRSTAEALCTTDPCDLHDGYGGATAFHGIATSASMATACPDCYVLVIQDAPAVDGSAVGFVAANLPWVDFVSGTNLSGIGNPTGPAGLLLESYQQATRELADSGRLFFAASGDDGVSGIYDPFPGYGYTLPPWVVAVGGMTALNPFPDAVEKHCNAIDVLSGAPADTLGDFSQSLPLADTINGYKVQRGSSFAAPQLAARYGQSLATLRDRLGDLRAPGLLWAGPAQSSPALADGQLTATEMREAFSSEAHYFLTADFNPACVAEVEQKFLAIPTLVSPLRPTSPMPWLDMGWGYVGADEMAAATAVLLGSQPAQTKPMQANSFMQSFITARETLFPIP